MLRAPQRWNSENEIRTKRRRKKESGSFHSGRVPSPTTPLAAARSHHPARDKNKARTKGLAEILGAWPDRCIKSYGRVTWNRVTGCRGETEGVLLVATTCRQMGVVSAITMGVVLSRRVATAPRALQPRCTLQFQLADDSWISLHSDKSREIEDLDRGTDFSRKIRNNFFSGA